MNINNEFMDLSIVKKINKLKKEQEIFFSSDIKNGFAYINEEKTKFCEKVILENTLTMMIPVSFYEGIFSNNFSNNIFYNFDSSVFIEFAVMFSNMEQNDSKLLQLQVLDYIKEQSKMVILSKGDFLTNENKKIFYVESLIKEKENNRYYLLCFFEIKSYFILNIFYCIDYRLQDWKTIFFQMAKTLKIL